MRVEYTEVFRSNCSTSCGKGIIQTTTISCKGTAVEDFACTIKNATEECYGDSCPQVRQGNSKPSLIIAYSGEYYYV